MSAVKRLLLGDNRKGYSQTYEVVEKFGRAMSFNKV
jgi:hypothetical protein